MTGTDEPATVSDKGDVTKRMPWWLVTVPIAYLAVLALSAWLLRNSGPLKIFEISIPVAAMWFGALGGVISSLQGMFFHLYKWEDKFTLWHVFSGVVGAAYGIVSYLFLVVIMNAGTSTPPKLDSPLFALGAFAIGYGQSQFHAMMTKVFDVLFRDTTSTQDAKPNQPKTDA